MRGPVAESERVLESGRGAKHTIIAAQQLPELVACILKRGYELLGPTVRDGAIVYDRLNSADELPRGWTDVQEPAKYRLARRSDDAYFGYNVGPHSWKKFLHPPTHRLWKCTRDGGGLHIVADVPAPVRRAFFAVRAAGHGDSRQDSRWERNCRSRVQNAPR